MAILKWLFWALVGLLAIAGMASHLIGGAAPAAVQPPEQQRHNQVQALVNRLEAQLIAHIKAGMHDPGSFDLADETVTDRGSYVIVHIRYRGKNPLGVTVLDSAVIAADLDGTVRVLEVRN